MFNARLICIYRRRSIYDFVGLSKNVLNSIGKAKPLDKHADTNDSSNCHSSPASASTPTPTPLVAYPISLGNSICVMYYHDSR